MRTAVYLRISKDDNATGLAVERQRADCQAIVAARGWTMTQEYVDNAISASKRDVRRPAYDRMVADYEAGAFDAIVCYDLDRLTRQPRQLEDWIDAAEERGLVIITANGEADLSNDNGRMFARIKATIARAEIERKGARQLRANEQRFEQGRPMPGRRRFGYEPDGVTPREIEAATVRRLFQHVADGGSIRSISQTLTAEGVDPAPGRSWSPGRVRYILTNPVYDGQTVRRGEAQRSAAVIPIVSAELAGEVRAILADDARRTTPGPKPRFLASGIASCGVCGGLMFNLARAYRCRASASHPAITRERLDDRIRYEVAFAVLVEGRALAVHRTESVAPLVEALEKNDDAARAIVSDRDEGLVSPAVARSRLIALREERLVTTEALERARVERSALGALAADAEALSGTQIGRNEPSAVSQERLPEIAAKFAALDIDRQREIVRALLDIEVHPGRTPERVKVRHLLADALQGESPEAIMSAEYWAEAAGARRERAG